MYDKDGIKITSITEHIIFYNIIIPVIINKEGISRFRRFQPTYKKPEEKPNVWKNTLIQKFALSNCHKHGDGLVRPRL